jgi:TrmH family RNA methyltransferase
MITKAQVKHIRSLEDKKYRSESGSFVVEGDKMVLELIHNQIEIKHLFATKNWIENHQVKLNSATPLTEVLDSELERISFLSSPNQVLAEVYFRSLHFSETSGHALLLDSIQDPGNMGSIIRIADWFGITHVYCFGQCVDVFNPKVVQSTIGSIFRLNIRSIEMDEMLELSTKYKFIGATLGGDNIAQISKTEQMALVIGNESKGIRNEIMDLCAQCVTIPKKGHAESLNAAVATGILCHALLC